MICGALPLISHHLQLAVESPVVLNGPVALSPALRSTADAPLLLIPAAAGGRVPRGAQRLWHRHQRPGPARQALPAAGEQCSQQGSSLLSFCLAVLHSLTLRACRCPVSVSAANAAPHSPARWWRRSAGPPAPLRLPLKSELARALMCLFMCLPPSSVPADLRYHQVAPEQQVGQDPPAGAPSPFMSFDLLYSLTENGPLVSWR